MHAQVCDLLAQGLIRRSDSEYSSPVVMVRKSNGDYRMCIDFRKINPVAKTFAYPLPFMGSILLKLRKARYISTIDISKGYYQIPMHEDSVKYTAFAEPRIGLFEFLRLPSGLSGAPAVF